MGAKISIFTVFYAQSLSGTSVYVTMRCKMIEERRTIEVVAAVISDGAGRVLATQCPPHKHNGGWEFPGGKIEPGEAPQAAVVREIREELGVTVQVGELLHTIEWDYPAFHLRMFCYACIITQGQIQLREHTAYCWASAADLPNIPWLPADVDALPAVAAWLSAV